MKITPKLKKWLVDNVGIKADATDEEFLSAATTALASGKLTPDEYKNLSIEDTGNKASEFNQTLKSMVDAIELLKNEITELKAVKPAVEKPVEPVKETPVEGKKTVADTTAPIVEAITKNKGDVEVKEAADQYSTSKKAMTYPEFDKNGFKRHNAGQLVKDFTDGGRTIDEASDQEKAVVGAFCKFLIASSQKGRTLGFNSLSDHEKELLHYGMKNYKWNGSTVSDERDSMYADIKNRPLTPTEQKDLIDDNTSGGLEAAPIVFDDMVITTPLLYGELFPLVNVVPLERGRRIEGVATGHVTGSWGGVDATAISLFNTSGYVTAFDTTIYRWEGAFRIGLDFLSDTPIDFAAHVTKQYGERLLEDLDDVVAVGNGTTQPEGIMNKSGATSVSFGGSTSLGSYESLRFGVAKPEHKSNLMNSIVFCGTETSYQRARAIPVGGSDARRLGGMNYDSYTWMERPYKINESLSNQQIFYAVLGRYRMYRRRGLFMRRSMEGDTLVRANEMLIVAMARFGGQMERGACIARTTDAPA